ncbi:MAG: putative Ig domain-containing protein [Terriglobales bacterium]
MRRRCLTTAASILLLAFSLACGGGLSSGSGSGGSSGPALTIVNDSLRGTLTGQPYSATLIAQNGVGALTWSISPLSPTTQYVTGLSIDPATGVLSGTANFEGGAGFNAKVVDSASPPRTAIKGFTIGASSPLQAGGPQSATVRQYQTLEAFQPSFSEGVFPYSFSLSGTLSPGLLLNPTTGQISGPALTAGVFVSTLTIQDSFSPPEVVTEPVAITVLAPPLTLANSLPSRLLQNRPFSGRVIATGGAPPYHFSVVSGSMPPGISSIDPNSGQTSGTPTTLGDYSVTLSVTDTDTPPQSVNSSVNISVGQPIGRNDTIATATPVTSEITPASISPYIDPPGGAPLPADNDYYKLVSLAGPTNIVHVQTQSAGGASLLDTVIEILDGNGTRYTTCRQPGDTSSNFKSSCLNDDVGVPPAPLDSALDFQVPGSTNTATTFYVHVLDWRGDARPDMIYYLGVAGLVPPMNVSSPPLIPAARTRNYGQLMKTANNIGSVTWTKQAGNLPPGIALGTDGQLTGIATANGIYSFTVQATDSATPPQTATAQESIQVVDPVKITSSPNLPNACLNQPYTFTPTTTGGIAPFNWGINGNWISIHPDASTGVFSGSATVTGTFSAALNVADATITFDSQTITLTVNQCP